jgi:phytoene dehydrogenase-like protein
VRRSLDTLVLGGGIGGLVAAGLLARSGRSVLLLEAHDKTGGSAGWYESNGFTFDAGATTLVGFDPGDPLDAVVRALGVDREREVPLDPVDGVSVDVAGTSFLYGRDAGAFEEAAIRLFPGALPFLRRVRRDAGLLWETARRWPRLPATGPGDLRSGLRIASPGLLRLAPSFRSTVADVLRSEGAPRDLLFRPFVDLALLVSVQSPAEAAPWWNGALGLDLFRRGVSRPRGGMRSFVAALEAAVLRAGGEARTRTKVVHLRRSGDAWVARTASGEEISSRSIVCNVPLPEVASLLDPELARRSRSEDERVGEGWGALVLNLGLSRVVEPGTCDGRGRGSDRVRVRVLHRLLLSDPETPPEDGNSLFVSISPPGDTAAPPGGQVVSVSTHTSAPEWLALPRAAYLERKQAIRERMLAPLRRLWPSLDEAIVHEDLGTPRTFRRFARRSTVGGLRARLGNTGFSSVDPTLGLPEFQLASDTTFPGQGTLAVAMSGALAAERLGAVRLHRSGEITFR